MKKISLLVLILTLIPTIALSAPTALDSLKSKMEKLVLPEDRQGEEILSFEFVRFPDAYYYPEKAASVILKRESEHAAQIGTVDKFVLLTKPSIKTVMNALFKTMDVPYFCQNYLDKNGKPYGYEKITSRQCKYRTYKLLKYAMEKYLTFIVKVEGNDHGDLEYVSLYVQNLDDENDKRLLNVHFDILHEI